MAVRRESPKQVLFAQFAAVDPLEENVEISFGCADCPNQIFIRSQRIGKGALGFVTELVEPSRKATVEDCCKLLCESLRIGTTKGRVQV